MRQKEFSRKECLSLVKRCTMLFMFLAIGLQGYAQTTPKVSAKIDTTFIKIGEQIQYQITVETDSTDLVFFPEGQTFSPLETVEAFATDTTRKQDRVTLQKTYALTQFDSGVYVIPRQRIAINEKPFFTDSIRVNVATVPVDTLKQKMFDIKPLLQVEKRNSTFWLMVLGMVLGIFLLAFLLYWFLLRKKPLAEEEKEALLPAYDRALMELKRLENSRYIIQDEYKKYYSELTDIVRLYLEEDVNVSAMESTTDELMEKLEMLTDSGNLELEKDTLAQFKRILQTADLVKFAKSKPDSNVAEADRKSIEQIVIKTKEAIPEPTEEELLQQEEYRLALEKKKQRKRIYIAIAVFAGVLLISGGAAIAHYGYSYVKDRVIGHPTKELLDGEWVSSGYGYPPMYITTPKVLLRKKLPQNDSITATQEPKGGLSATDSFVYGSMLDHFYIAVNAVPIGDAVKELALSGVLGEDPSEEEVAGKFLAYVSDQSIKELEKRGAKNLIVKDDNLVVGEKETLKVYGKFVAQSELTGEKLEHNYQFYYILDNQTCYLALFVYQGDDIYAEPIIERAIKSITFKEKS